MARDVSAAPSSLREALYCVCVSLVRGNLVAERLASHLGNSLYVCMYMYVSVTLRNPIISRATRKRSITCANVTLRNVTAEPAIAVREKTKSSLYVQL